MGVALMEIILRAAAIYFFIWIATKALGKRELAQLSAFEFILLVTMGDLIQQGVTGDDRSVTGAVLAVSTISVLIAVSSLLSYKSRRLRSVLDGFPVIVVRDGRPMDESLRAERLTVEEVMGAARDQGIDDLRRVRVGILEPDGKFSFIVDHDGSRQQRTQSQEGTVS
jgi:uncharacterized membrane protein YcaP (DUF421 family)